MAAPFIVGSTRPVAASPRRRVFSLRPSPLALLSLLLATLLTTPARAADAPLDARTEAAIDRGLAFLASRQERSGCFPGADRYAHSTAVHSLAVMAFLARGHTPGQGPYGEKLNAAIDWALAQQNPTSGMLSTAGGEAPMYDHGITTVMLCEVAGMVDEGRRPKVQAAIAKAAKLILDAHKVHKDGDNQGGWRYGPTASDSDISVTGWQLMALRGAANAGAAVPPAALETGIAYLRRRIKPDGGFTYTGPGDPSSPARTGTGVLALELLGQHASKETLAGGDYLLRNPSAGSEFYFYAVYYCSQAANQLGGKYFAGIYLPLRDLLLRQQDAGTGAWRGAGQLENQIGDTYCTAMAVLALCVPYRYLPLYQR